MNATSTTVARLLTRDNPNAIVPGRLVPYIEVDGKNLLPVAEKGSAVISWPVEAVTTSTDETSPQTEANPY